MTSEIAKVLIRRDGMDLDEALDLIAEAKEVLMQYLENGDMEGAENICREYFRLEEDYVMELLF